MLEAAFDWFMGLGDKYNVNPIVFGSIYIGAIPFFMASIAWLVRNVRSGRSPALPVLSAGFFFISAYLYLLVFGRDIPIWVYALIVGLIGYGAWSSFRKIRAKIRAAKAQREEGGGHTAFEPIQ